MGALSARGWAVDIWEWQTQSTFIAAVAVGLYVLL
jgi:hypothetical protein